MGAGPALARRRAAEQPASFVAFDVLAVLGRDVRPLPLSERRGLLEELAKGFDPPLELCPSTFDRAAAQEWWDDADRRGFEGIVANSLLNERVDAVREGDVLCRDGVCTGYQRGGLSSRRGCQL